MTNIKVCNLAVTPKVLFSHSSFVYSVSMLAALAYFSGLLANEIYQPSRLHVNCQASGACWRAYACVCLCACVEVLSFCHDLCRYCRSEDRPQLMLLAGRQIVRDTYTSTTSSTDGGRSMRKWFVV